MPGLIDDSLTAGQQAYSGLESATDQAKNQFIQNLQLKDMAKSRVRGLVGTLADTAGRYAPELEQFVTKLATAKKPAQPPTGTAGAAPAASGSTAPGPTPDAGSSATDTPSQLPGNAPAPALPTTTPPPGQNHAGVASGAQAPGGAAPATPAASPAQTPPAVPKARHHSALLGTILKEVGHGLTSMFGGSH